MKSDTLGNGVEVTPLHEHTHNGLAFAASQYDAALAASGALEIQIKVPANKTMHLKEPTLYTTGSSAKFEMRYEPTVTDGTTAIVPVNRRPTFPKDSEITLFSDPTTISGGTLMEEFSLGSGGNLSGGSFSGEDEWLIEGGASGVDVTLVFTNNAVGVEILSLKITWYE